MISLILYGRNDSYGYNLHKRAALSLNCMAELLTDADDEILFVDYNTPDDYPTFPEAIRDTLTEQARRLLRVLRVRPAHHALFRERTHLMAVEPIARNVALRRSNPANRWVLSTNTDMIFVPRNARSLTEIVAGLPSNAFYHLPRFEIPETLWEGLPRMEPAHVIAQVADWGWHMHLNEIVYGSEVILYDGPGDFQLAARSDLFRIHGFDECMLRGWHVDSNLARRLGMLLGGPSSLVEHLFGYHCDHTRQVTPAHRHDRVENDSGVFVDAIDDPVLTAQADEWGLAGELIEELRLEGQDQYAAALRAAMGSPLPQLAEIRYAAASYDQVGYEPSHVVPFLADALSSYPRQTTVGWISAQPALLLAFATAWRGLGFTGHILVLDLGSGMADVPCGCRWAEAEAIAREASVFVVDFASPPTSPPGALDPAGDARDQVAIWFRMVVAAERRRLTDPAAAPRRFIAVNAVHGRFEPLVNSLLAAAAAPIATRLRQGFVICAPQSQPVLHRLGIGSAGQREAAGVTVLAGQAGYVIYGGDLDLLPGGYRLHASFELAEPLPPRSEEEPMTLEVVTAGYCLARHPITIAQLREGTVIAPFYVPRHLMIGATIPRTGIQLLTTGTTGARLTGLLLEDSPVLDDPSVQPEATVEDGVPGYIMEWLPSMFVGSAGRLPRTGTWSHALRPGLHRRPAAADLLPASPHGVIARPRTADHVVFGPYCVLLPGSYRLEVDLQPWPMGRSAWHDTGEITVEVYGVDGSVLALHTVAAGWLGRESVGLEFTVPEPGIGLPPVQWEFRIWSAGQRRFVVRSVRTRPLTATRSIDRSGESASLTEGIV
ncbi:MAG TPA: hypothetical protein VFW75_11935 [Acetobacteraceae bacterium]|nr:hypothetical protein [Acetobacteraceae bacterium]